MVRVHARACVVALAPRVEAGCQELLVLLGPTYSSRLWCCVELFTFLKMGGQHERIRVFEVGADRSTLGKFDASKAQCFLYKDRERLLAVIEAGYGDFERFNMVVRGILEPAVEKPGSLTKSKSWLGRARGDQVLPTRTS